MCETARFFVEPLCYLDHSLDLTRVSLSSVQQFLGSLPGITSVNGCVFGIQEELSSIEKLVRAIQEVRCIIQFSILFRGLMGTIANRSTKVLRSVLWMLRCGVNDDFTHRPTGFDTTAEGAAIPVP